MKTTMEPIKIPIFLPNEEAKKFLLFQQYYLPFMLMVEKGVFDQKNATVSLDFDKNGVLRSIRRADFLYTERM